MEARAASMSNKSMATAQETALLVQKVRALEEENSRLKANASRIPPGTLRPSFDYGFPLMILSSLKDLQIELNDLKIKLTESTAAATRYRNERNSLVKVVQASVGNGKSPLAPVANKK